MRDANEQILLIEVEATAVSESFPPCDLYLVAAYNKTNDYWSVRRGEWFTEDGARKSIAKLAGCWRSPHILHMHIPGTDVRP